MIEEPVSELRLTESLAMNWSRIGAIVWISGKYIGTIYRINPNQKIIFGRDDRQSDFILDDSCISRVHCWVSYDADNRCYYVCDCSRNGVILNGSKPMQKNTVTVLHAGDELKLAETDQIFKLG